MLFSFSAFRRRFAPVRAAVGRPEYHRDCRGTQPVPRYSLATVPDEPPPFASGDDHELVQHARSGDEEAFGRLMRLHYEPVFRLVNAMLRDEHAARDVCQEVWLTVWKRLPQFRGEAKFSTWIHPIATRRAIDHLRSRRRWFDRFLPFLGEREEEGSAVRIAGAPEAADERDFRAELERDEKKARFERAIATLPPKHRGVLALREIQGLSYDEIAANLGIARGTVMSRLFNARRLLAKKLGDLPCED